MQNEAKNKKVYVGLSGGVDSSVSVILLKQAGYDVTGVFIKGWQPDWIPCTWKTDRISAMRTAAYLDIPFITLDLENEYKSKVVEYILSEYSLGRTPNPDMLCNREIKFGAFLNWAIGQGADYVATGHYAQIEASGNKSGQEVFNMIESVDNEKDQTYFLSQITQKQLSRVLFPIGHLEKKDVRKLAEKYSLPVATRKDSQGICFVGDLEMKDFLIKELKPVSGDVLDTNGQVIGQHSGSILYTLGERHGFEIYNKSEDQKNMYIVEKDIAKNTIIVAEKINLDYKENTKEIKIRNLSFTNNYEAFKDSKELKIRIRYRGEKYSAKILNYSETKNEMIVEVECKIEYAPGQFAVFYSENICLGGGELE